MKKLIAVMILLCLFSYSMPVFAKEPPVPVAPDGALVFSEATEPLSEDERQYREAAYAEILALAQTDDTIAAVKLSADNRWIFWTISADPETTKEYVKRFEQYTPFFILTDNIDKAESDINRSYGADKTTGADQSTHPASLLWVICGTAVLLLGAAVLFIRARALAPALQTVGGSLVGRGTAVNKKEAVSAVKNYETALGEQVYTSIMRQIEKSVR